MSEPDLKALADSIPRRTFHTATCHACDLVLPFENVWQRDLWVHEHGRSPHALPVRPDEIDQNYLPRITLGEETR